MKKPAQAAVPVTGLSLEPIVLNGQTLDLNYYFSQDYTNIEEAGQELPAIVEWVNAQLQIVYEDMLTFKDELEQKKGEVYFDLRNGSFSETHGGRPTVDALEYAVLLDPQVREIQKKLNNLKGWVKRLTNLQNSLQTKLDLIRSSEATRRRLVEAPELGLERASRRAADPDDQD